MLTVFSLSVLLLVAQLPVAAPTLATVPGDNGRIAFTMGGVDAGLYTMNTNGSGLTRLTFSEADAFPKWSPNGGKIAFSSDRSSASPHVYTVNSDGSSFRDLTPGGLSGEHPAWSPDGMQIAYDTGDAIYVVTPDGEGTPILSGDHVMWPVWSPDGTKIAFERFDNATTLSWQIWTMNADGTGQVQLTNTVGGDLWPDWSPDGSKIVFQRGDSSPRIYSMNPDGTSQTPLTDTGYWNPTWSPDGTRIGFLKPSAPGFWAMNPDGSGQTRLSTTPNMDFPHWQSVQVGLSFSAASVAYGSAVTVTAHLRWYQTSDNQTLSIYKKPYGGTSTLVASGAVDGEGNFSASVVVYRQTAFTAIWSGDTDHPAGGISRRTVGVYPLLRGRLSGQYGSSGKYRLYHYTANCPSSGKGCPTYTASVTPNHQGKSIAFTLQRFGNGAWHTAQLATFRLNADSQRTVFFVYANRTVIGKQWRIRFTFLGDLDHVVKTSAWSFFKVTT